MKNTIKLALLPCLGALALAAVPAQAVIIPSNGATAATMTSGASAGTSMTKQQLKQQAKLRKQCAKLAGGKISSKKRATLTAMCASATSEQVAKPSVPASSGTPAPSSTGSSSPDSPSSQAVATIYSAAALYVPAAQAPEKGEDAVSLATDPTSVPEPGSLALLGLGLVGLGLARRRVGR